LKYLLRILKILVASWVLNIKWLIEGLKIQVIDHPTVKGVLQCTDVIQHRHF